MISLKKRKEKFFNESIEIKGLLPDPLCHSLFEGDGRICERFFYDSLEEQVEFEKMRGKSIQDWFSLLHETLNKTIFLSKVMDDRNASRQGIKRLKCLSAKHQETSKEH